VDAFMAALEDSVPENALLLSTTFSRGCTPASRLVSDVELVDDYPSSVLSHARGSTGGCAATGRSCSGCFPSCRRARPQAQPAARRSALEDLDNLRRSLVAPALLALLVAGWLVLPGRPACGRRGGGRAASQLLPVLARLLIGPAGRSPFRCSSPTCATTPRPRWPRCSSA
jgi:cyclic beta-1,2-glucan synthetase